MHKECYTPLISTETNTTYIVHEQRCNNSFQESRQDYSNFGLQPTGVPHLTELGLNVEILSLFPGPVELDAVGVRRQSLVFLDLR